MSDIGETIRTITEKLVPNLLSFVIQFLSFLVMLVAFFVLAYKPVKRILQKRADFIQKEIDDAKENQRLAASKVEEASAILANSRLQASTIIKQAEQQSFVRAETIVEEAKVEAQNLLTQAQDEIVLAKEEALESIRAEMVNVALAASKEILKREISEVDNTRLAEDFVNRLN